MEARLPPQLLAANSSVTPPGFSDSSATARSLERPLREDVRWLACRAWINPELGLT